MGWGAFIKAVAEEWAVIAAAPITFSILVLLAGFLILLLVRFLYSHQITNSKSTNENLQSIIKLNQATISGLKSEIEGMKKLSHQHDNAPPQQLLPVMTGNAAIQGMFNELAHGNDLAVSTHPTDSSKWKHVVFTLPPDEFEKLAAARRLVEIGFAEVKEQKPGSYTLVSTATTARLSDVYNAITKDKKK